MPKVDDRNEVCDNCGVEVRPDTQFCYSCGKSVISEVGRLAGNAVTVIEESADNSESSQSLIDLEKALSAEFPPKKASGTRLEAAAAKRRQSRKGVRKSIEIVWEPLPDDATRIYFLFALLIFFGTVAIVFFTVFWK